MSEEPAVAPVEELEAPQPQQDREREQELAVQREIDSRSVYVGNVDYQSTPEQLEEFFHSVGVIERVTILFDRYTGLPKGYAYVEFETVESAEKAIEELHGKVFRGRDLRLTPKRTNLPGFRPKPARGRGGFRGRGRGRGRGGRGRGRGRGGRGDSQTEVSAEAS